MTVLSRDRFVAWIAEQLDIDARQLNQVQFADLDSLQLFEIDLLVEELGVLLDEDELASCLTIHDVFDAYTRQASASTFTHEQ